MDRLSSLACLLFFLGLRGLCAGLAQGELSYKLITTYTAPELQHYFKQIRLLYKLCMNFFGCITACMCW